MHNKDMKTATENRKMQGVTLHRWGDRFICSIFPEKNGNHRVTVKHKGQEYTWAGKNRMKVLKEAFSFIQNK